MVIWAKTIPVLVFKASEDFRLSETHGRDVVYDVPPLWATLVSDIPEADI